MGKFILKVLGWLAVIGAALAALLYWDRCNTPEYIELYSNEDEEEDAF